MDPISSSSDAAGTEAEQKLTELLQGASDHLRADRLEAAEREVDEALALAPDDLRARNLRGLIFFRAGRHPEALAVYETLMQTHSEDMALRLNLGLVELRMGHYAKAAVNLQRVVTGEPDNARAQGYLGLALLRSGDLAGAREAFERSGQPELVRQVEQRLAQLGQDEGSARGELQRAALDAARVLDAEQPFSAAEEAGRRGQGSWQLRRPGERVPVPGPEGGLARPVVPLKLSPPQPVSVFATARLLRPGELGVPFALAEGGMLLVRVDGKLSTRTVGAIASTGNLSFEPLMRRVRGRVSEEPFGEGAGAMFSAVGHGLVAVAPLGGRFTALELQEDIVYLRESVLFSFEEGLHWESGRVPGSGPAAEQVVQFRGRGRLVMRTEREAVTLKLEPDSTLFVEAGALAGWIGRVVPRILCGPGGEPTPYVECTGEGVLILEEPASPT